MEAAINQLKSFAGSANDTGRRTLLEALIQLQFELETPLDTLSRLYGAQLQPTVARIGVDLGIFDFLAQSDATQSVEAIAKKTGAAPTLTGRLLRFMASVGMIQEADKDMFTANKVTKLFAQPGYQGGIHHIFDTCGPIYQALPDFLISTKHQDIADNARTALQPAFNTDLPGFIWFPSQKERFGYFQQVMGVQRSSSTWLSAFPLAKQLENWGPTADQATFVDIGGGFGHQCQAFKAAVPKADYRIILQELPQTLEHVPSLEGIETQAHNFFEPQPVHGARFYYLRNILHDWPTDKAIAILQNLIPALSPQSAILIDDMLLPNKGVHRYATQQDISMMAALGAQERTREQWEGLVDAAGLQIKEIHPYSTVTYDAVLVLSPKQG